MLAYIGFKVKNAPKRRKILKTFMAEKSFQCSSTVLLTSKFKNTWLGIYLPRCIKRYAVKINVVRTFHEPSTAGKCLPCNKINMVLKWNLLKNTSYSRKMSQNCHLALAWETLCPEDYFCSKLQTTRGWQQIKWLQILMHLN